MGYVCGKIVLDVAFPVDSDEESMGLLQANYTLNRDRLVAYHLTATDCKGKQHKILVNDCVEMELGEFV